MSLVYEKEWQLVPRTWVIMTVSSQDTDQWWGVHETLQGTVQEACVPNVIQSTPDASEV
jgi:hypothetical protein